MSPHCLFNLGFTSPDLGSLSREKANVDRQRLLNGGKMAKSRGAQSIYGMSYFMKVRSSPNLNLVDFCGLRETGFSFLTTKTFTMAMLRFPFKPSKLVRQISIPSVRALSPNRVLQSLNRDMKRSWKASFLNSQLNAR